PDAGVPPRVLHGSVGMWSRTTLVKLLSLPDNLKQLSRGLWNLLPADFVVLLVFGLGCLATLKEDESTVPTADCESRHIVQEPSMPRWRENKLHRNVGVLG